MEDNDYTWKQSLSNAASTLWVGTSDSWVDWCPGDVPRHCNSQEL